jgi:hypothetical protein
LYSSRGKLRPEGGRAVGTQNGKHESGSPRLDGSVTYRTTAGIDPEHRAIVKTILKRAVVVRLRRKELTLLRGGRYEPRPDTLKGECTL